MRRLAQSINQTHLIGRGDAINASFQDGPWESHWNCGHRWFPGGTDHGALATYKVRLLALKIFC
jgi:hypothetical protein